MTNPQMTFHLLTIFGKVKPTSIEATRQLHNQTAGDPGGVAAAKSFGDLSHLTFMPANAEKEFTGDLLFMDIWNNLDGMNTFFTDKQVLGGAEMMFGTREAVVWSKLSGFLNYDLGAPSDRKDRIVGIVRGKVKSLDEAEAIHNSSIAGQVNVSRAAGIVSHEFYSRLAAPGSSEALEVLGVDVWTNEQSMLAHYSSPGFQNSGLYKMFAAKPSSSTWTHPKGEWVEW